MFSFCNFGKTFASSSMFIANEEILFSFKCSFLILGINEFNVCIFCYFIIELFNMSIFNFLKCVYIDDVFV